MPAVARFFVFMGESRKFSAIKTSHFVPKFVLPHSVPKAFEIVKGDKWRKFRKRSAVIYVSQ